MTVTLQQTRQALDDLINGHRPPEDVVAWAESAMHAGDAGQLVYDPPEEQKRIWHAIHFMLGMSEKVSPTEYLHGPETVIAYRRERDI
jgi:hypothetical protein